MPHLHRFQIPPQCPTQAEIPLEGAELHHALNVLRLREGENVALFDGAGRELLGHVCRRDKRSIWIAVDEERQHAATNPHITLAQAWLHNDKAVHWLVKHGTEIGIQRFLFFRAERSLKAPRTNDKLERVMVEACKQCGRAWLPKIETVAGLEEAISGDYDARWVGALEEQPVAFRGSDTAGRVLLLIGPEGDFTADEMRLAIASGAKPFSLGETVYRGEVAAVLAATLIQYENGKLGALPRND